MHGWNGPYIFELKPDPWGNSFQYRNNGRLLLFSKGPDRIADTADDIRVDDTTPDIPRVDQVHSPSVKVQKKSE